VQVKKKKSEMIYHPNNVWSYGKNKNYSLAAIYHYLPTYIEFLIKYDQEFEIESNEFLALPKPVKYYAPFKLCLNNKEFNATANMSHDGSVEKMMNIKPEKLKEFEYTFPKEYLEILELKKIKDYTAPKYESPTTSPVLDIMSKRKKKS
jgi:hypothetical protein